MPLYQIVRIIDAITFGQMIDFYDVQAVYNYFGYPVSRFTDINSNAELKASLALQMNLLMRKSLMEKGML